MTKAKTNGGAADLPGLDRITALFNWRLPDLPRYPELPLASFRTFTTRFNDAYHHAASQQLDATLAANERLAGLARQFMSARDPQSLIAAEAEIVTCLAETGATNARIWAETAQQMQECCGQFVQEAAAVVQASAPTAPAPPATA